MTGVYACHAPAYADAGLPVFPVDTRNKRPSVRGWQNADPRRARIWRGIPNLAASQGVGLVMGRPSGVTEIDVDAVGGGWITVATERFGDTSIIIRTASGKAKLWYRHNGEGRHIRPFTGLPIDVLGGGFTIAPPSWRDDIGEAYSFIKGGLADIANLPGIRADAMDEGFVRAAEAIQRGERNSSLWRYCMAQARHCDDVEALIDVAVTWASAFPEPLTLAEAEQCARSAFRYEISGRNYLGLSKPQLTHEDRSMDELIDQPEALVLFQMFKRWHGSRAAFAIAPTAMSAAGSPPWHRTRIVRARDVLMERGFLVEISAPVRGVRAGRYRLARQMAESGKDHYTPAPPSLGPSFTEGRA